MTVERRDLNLLGVLQAIDAERSMSRSPRGKEAEMFGSRKQLRLTGMFVLAFAGCSGTSGNPNTADSANCDNGFLCGAYLDGDGDGRITQDEWNRGYQAADTDGDGALSAGEFHAAGGRR